MVGKSGGVVWSVGWSDGLLVVWKVDQGLVMLNG